MNPNRIFRQTTVVLSLIAMAMILIAPSATQSAPEAPAQPPVIIDVEISLHKTTVPAADRTKYENIIKYFADAIFEASEGENKIGKVTFYLGGTCSDKADVVWTASCHPSGDISGRGVNGLFINFCDVFSPVDFLANDWGHQGGGYTLAHEWGHYYYSMYDEYAEAYTPCYFPNAGDDPVPDAIMNDQWDARGGNYEWLNFSTANSYQMSGGGTRDTAQWRVYGADCWTTLARPVASDPAPCFPGLPARIHHPELAAVAPAAGSDPNIDLPDTDARSDLEFVWGSCQTAYQIVIDRSGSMTGSKLPNVKTAAKMLVDLAPLGYSTIGVISYNQNVTVEHPLTAINSAADKTTIKNKIDLITRGGNTAIGDAAQKAHDDLVAAPGLGSYNKTVYLLSDGRNTAGSNPVSVIPSYQTSKIPIYAFAYGSDADTTLMQKLATDTNGKYYISPTSLTDITNAFQDANLQSSPTVGISKGKVETASILGPIAPDADIVSFRIDSTLSHFDVVVVFTGKLNDMEFSVRSPYPYNIYENLVCTQDEPSEVKERLCYYGHDINSMDDIGLWDLIYYNAGEGETIFDYHVTGYPNPDQPPEKRFTYTASVTAFPYPIKLLSATPEDFIKLPQPVKLVAVLAKDLPINGAEAIATITYQDGTTEPPLELLDNGILPDAVMNDGQYTGVFYPEVIGAYNVSVQFTAFSGSAAMTKIGRIPAQREDGKPSLPEPDIPLSDSFERNASIQVNVLDYDKIYLPLVENK
jgi:uncharacterized protein YegL